jgi:hypothetical protein
MDPEQRRDASNIVLVCPTHHKLIDDVERERHTVEILQRSSRHAAPFGTWPVCQTAGHGDAALGRTSGLGPRTCGGSLDSAHSPAAGRTAKK